MKPTFSFRPIVRQAFRIIGRLLGRDNSWALLAPTRAKLIIDAATWGTAERLFTWRSRQRLPKIANHRGSSNNTNIDRYWSSHTVWARPFLSKQSSLNYIQELTDGRKLKRQLLKLHGPHKNKVIMDYGCGPGNDLAGFTEYSDAKKIIGVDISQKALRLARQRVSWHATAPDRLSFVLISDNQIELPFETNSIDYIQSLGVVHHASDPNAILKEMSRILKPGGEIRLMLYNADSIHVQLVVGYQWRLLDNITSELSSEKAFEKSADLGAPKADCVRPADVNSWCAQTGLTPTFLGGYFMPGENEACVALREQALKDTRVTAHQRDFLQALTCDEDGYYKFNGLPAGLGGVYVLRHAD